MAMGFIQHDNSGTPVPPSPTAAPLRQVEVRMVTGFIQTPSALVQVPPSPTVVRLRLVEVHGYGIYGQLDSSGTRLPSPTVARLRLVEIMVMGISSEAKQRHLNH